MKHTDWLRLQSEGEKICASLRQQDYQCLKQTRRLSWKISKESTSYLLTWLPAPVSDWSLIPNDTNPAWEQLMQVVQGILNTIRGTQANTYQRIEQPEDYSRPWAIVRLLPDLRRYTVASSTTELTLKTISDFSTASYPPPNLKSSSMRLQMKRAST